jgi:hypothetical protein
MNPATPGFTEDINLDDVMGNSPHKKGEEDSFSEAMASRSFH